ncbi:MAG: dTDP-4-dehydrorhamnose reductase [Cereibacter sphaeroides]|uniref:dTDP-4-dehydrorhamnose reductase n=1 Tax=Cereibacter sphaeroides TaxID=1063 RepID=A0A2W5UR96_CERSP|nr:MAG: dTDP-4-dehydrorhamnose reductase [Cereibacter sphaeroides]
MTLLVFGSTGQVAQELRRRAPDAIFLSRAEVDLSDPAACAAAVASADVEAVINAAGYTAVDKAESEEELATVINGAAPGAMARAAAKRDLPFLHISSDYVFNGSGDVAWHTDDETGPLGAYGRSKLAGEHGVHAAGGSFVILRTSWVFSSHGTNFVKTMLRLGKQRDSLAIVADQIGGPTAAGDIADALIEIARLMRQGNGAPGTYHFAGAPDVSWADFAREIFHSAHLPTKVVNITSAEYPTPARRPHNSRLNCSTTERMFGLPRPDWRANLATILKELGDN